MTASPQDKTALSTVLSTVAKNYQQRNARNPSTSSLHPLMPCTQKCTLFITAQHRKEDASPGRGQPCELNTEVPLWQDFKFLQDCWTFPRGRTRMSQKGNINSTQAYHDAGTHCTMMPKGCQAGDGWVNNALTFYTTGHKGQQLREMGLKPTLSGP